MKLSASALLFGCLSVLLCHVQAGFCDGKSGNHCRTKDYISVSTRCVCETKTKKSKKGTKYEQDCDNEGDTPCGVNGCSFGRGTCLTNNEVCATVALNDVSYFDGSTTHQLKTTCPLVTGALYRTWKNRQLNLDTVEKDFLKKVVDDNKFWTKEVMLPKFYVAPAGATTKAAAGGTTTTAAAAAGGTTTTTAAAAAGGTTTTTAAAAGGRLLQAAPPPAAGATTGATSGSYIPEMSKAWDDNCNANDAKTMHCYQYFPKCYGNRGDTGQCDTYCSKMMKCVISVEQACLTAAGVDPTGCKKYETFGNQDCNAMCNENQNDSTYVASAGFSVAPFMTLVTVLAVAFM